MRLHAAVAALLAAACWAAPAHAGTPATAAGCVAIATGGGDSCDFTATGRSLGYTGITDTGWAITHKTVGGSVVTDDKGGAGPFNAAAGVLKPGIAYTLTVEGRGTGAGGTVDPTAAAGAPEDPAPRSSILAYDPCRATSWTAGTVDLCRGRLQYHDYVDDDYGASGGSSPSQSWGSFNPQAGNARYPSGNEGSADLAGLQLWIAGSRLHVRFQLAALYNATQTVGALAVDTDGDPATGGGSWGGLGVSSKGWDKLFTFDDGDPRANAVSGSVPLPPGSHWRVQAVTAQKGGPVMNVAFRGVDETGAWFEDGQAASLAAGDISRYGQEVDVADLTGRVTRRAADPGAGPHERVYTSRYTIGRGEGYDYDGVPGRAAGSPLFPQTYNFLGRYQPYGIYVPAGGGVYGAQLALHGSGVNMAPYKGNQALRFGVDAHRILVTPLARGLTGFYSDYSERDALDAFGDAERAYPVDRDRVLVSGYSMGGYGTLRFAALYPDRFAGYVNWVGFTGDDENGIHPGEGKPNTPIYYWGGARGNVEDLAGNLRWEPGANLYGGADELVHVWTSVNGLLPALQNARVPFVFYFHPVAEHFTFAVLDDWRKEAAYSRNLKLVHDPPRVSFRTARYLWDEALGLVQNDAYWVRDVQPAARDEYATVDLTTHGCGGSLPDVSPQTPGAGPDPVPWTSRSAAVSGHTTLARENALTGTIRGTSSLRIDAARSCLSSRRPLRLDVITDRDVTLRFSDGRTVKLEDSGAHEARLPSASATAAGPGGTYASVSEDPNYKIQPDDHPEYQVCLGSQEIFGSPSGSGPPQPQQGYNEIGTREGCDQADPRSGVAVDPGG